MTDAALLAERDALKDQADRGWVTVLDWERWAASVLTDYRVPFDDHKIGLRLGITQTMFDLKAERDALKARCEELEAYIRAMVEKAADANRPAYDEQQTIIMGLTERLAAAERDAGRRSFWVLERFQDGRGGQYWDGGNSRGFVTDISKAIQFCRREDVFWVTVGWHWKDVRITEHVAIDAALAGEKP